ncbi:MAG: hypothetical protein WD404_08945 [Solirubrobacterales bacterium]
MSKTADEVIEAIFNAAAVGGEAAAIAEPMRELWRGGGWSPERIVAGASAVTVAAAETEERVETPPSADTESEQPNWSVESEQLVEPGEGS